MDTNRVTGEAQGTGNAVPERPRHAGLACPLSAVAMNDAGQGFRVAENAPLSEPATEDHFPANFPSVRTALIL